MNDDFIAIFGRLVELDPAARAAEWDRIQLTPDQRREMERLLALDDRDSDWLSRLAERTLPGTLGALVRPEPGGTDFDASWELFEVIGSGGMGVVHRARDRQLDRIVALKFLSPDIRPGAEARDRLLAEARAASALDHPAIGVVYQIDVAGDQPFIAMAYYEGGTLASRMRRGPIGLGTALEWAIQAADGLAHAHRAGVVHRDVKPSNLIVTTEGRVKILDFGIAALRGGWAPAAGTVRYMSPEQRAGGAPTPADDVWSFGTVLLELLTGGLPDDARVETLSPTALPPRLVRILERCRALDPAERPADGGDLAAELRLVRRELDPGVGRDAILPRIAVLPFASIGLEADDEWFVDGIMDEVLSRLSRIRGLRVTGRATSRLMKGRLLSNDRIASELGVRYLLEGGVRRAGDRVRVSARLLDTSDDAYLWVDTIEGEVSEIFDIQERVAVGVAGALPVELSAPDEQGLRRRPLEDVRAWESYSRARHEAWQFSPEALTRARRHLEVALDLVGPNALLYSTLGHVEAISIDTGIAGGPHVLARIDDLADRTMDLDPESGRGSWLRAFAALHRGDMGRALRAGERALAALPTDPDVLVTTGYILARIGRSTRATELFERAIRIDPLTPLNRCMPGFVAALDGRAEEAVEPYRRMREMAPDAPFALAFHGWILAQAGRTDDAIATLSELPERFPGTVFDSWGASLAAGLAGDASTAAARITPAFEEAARGSELFARALTDCRALAGDIDGGLEALSTMVELGMLHLGFLARHDRLIEPLRNDPQFEGILAEARRRLEAIELA